MAQQYPPYRQNINNNNNNMSETSFGHFTAPDNDSSASLTGTGEKPAWAKAGPGGFKGANKRASSMGAFASSAAHPSARNNNNRKKWIIIGSVLAIVVIAGAVVGGVLGTKLNKNNNNTSKNANGISANDANVNAAAASEVVATTTLSNGTVQTQTSSVAAAASASASGGISSTPASVTPLPEWKWTQSSFAGAQSSGQGQPMYGAALGNWLVLEQWIDEPWFNASAGNNGSVRDEWTLMQVLGDRAQEVMTEHYETWVTEDDIEQLHQAGMNHLRIPVGFWAFIDCANGEPYLCNFNQTAYIERALGWAYTRGMYAIIDLHALPGSNNGEISSGHLTTNPTFFQDANQQRSKDTVRAALQFITNSPYRSVVSALQVINEPRPYTQGQFDMLENYFSDAYNQTLALDNPVPIVFHHGYTDQVLHTAPTTYWRSFVANKNPALISMSTHPYIGTFPLSSNQANMLSSVCNNVQGFVNFPVPILITEWSVRTGVNTVAFERQLYTSEVVNWAMTGGSIFWNFKAVNGNVNNGDNSQWSFLTLLEKGSVPTPSSGQSQVQWLASLNNNCGTTPTVSWASSS